MRENNRLQFGIGSLLIAAAVVAVMCGLFVAARNQYYAERRQVNSLLADVDGISILSLHSHVEFTEEIGRTSISVDRHPGSIVQLGSLRLYEDTGRFFVSRIGNWRFNVSGRRHLGAYIAATGQPVESDYFGNHIVLGPGSPYSEQIPFEVKTLQDVVDHYDDLIDLLNTWPGESEPGTVTLEDGTTQYYYVTKDPSSPE